MDTVKLQVEEEDLADVVELARLAFEERLAGTGSSDEVRLRPVIDSLKSQLGRAR